jgi:hypothetical protein
MITRNTLTAMTAALLLTASVGLAQTKTDPPKAATSKPPAAAKPAPTHVTNGTVQSISGSGSATTVVVKGSKSTDKPITLMLNAATTRTGDLAQGAKVTAHYRVESDQNIATSITASAAKPAPKAVSSTATQTPKKK